ncbi:hypothetical protein LXL04_020937 [Taraxacum kok-saghyz]
MNNSVSEDLEDGEIPTNSGGGSSGGSTLGDESSKVVPESGVVPKEEEVAETAGINADGPTHYPRVPLCCPSMFGGTPPGRTDRSIMDPIRVDPIANIEPIIPLSCFGPFPAQFPRQTIMCGPSVPSRQDGKTDAPSPLVFRRRHSKFDAKFHPYQANSKSRYSTPLCNPDMDTVPPDRGMHDDLRPIINLNESLPPSSSLSRSINIEEDCSSSTAEFNKLIGIGIEVGF